MVARKDCCITLACDIGLISVITDSDVFHVVVSIFVLYSDKDLWEWNRPVKWSKSSGKWWARLDLNQRPLPCEDGALPQSLKHSTITLVSQEDMENCSSNEYFLCVVPFFGVHLSTRMVSPLIKRCGISRYLREYSAYT